jgi:RimJ/RimL family protein N-acetyltransferase
MSNEAPATIATPRLVLRPLSTADAPRLAALANHAGIARRLGTMPYPYGQADALDFIARVRAALVGAACFALTLKPGAELIGVCGYGPAHGRPADAPPETDFGYWLGLDYWGKGYATEAAAAVLAHAFEISDEAVITTDYQIDNQASGRVLAKLGFATLGPRRRHSLASGGDVDTMQVELRRQDWLVRRRMAP